WLGGCWHIRDAMDYMMTAAKAVANMGAKLKEEYLFNHYWMGRRQIERGMAAKGGPFAYIIDPKASHDPSSVVEFMGLMNQSGIEFVRATEDFVAGGSTFPIGTYVIPPQAFRPYVVDLMEPKQYPDRRQYPGGPPEPPYDMTGYELRYQMGLQVVNVDEPFEMPAGEWGAVSTDVGEVRGEDRAGFVIHSTSNWVYRALQERTKKGDVLFRTTQVLTTAEGEVPAGSFWLPALTSSEAKIMASDFGLTLTGLATAPTSDNLAASTMPKVGIYRSYQAAMPEGWTRWTLDQYGFEWENVWDEDVRSGDLSRFDVIILPSQNATAIEKGHSAEDMPERYTGGLGLEGATALQSFVET
ncbi:uncharacterized protein METZ01_LOCUS255932, partial [marine metagenome]